MINFGHPLSAESLALISDMCDCTLSQIVDVKVQVSQDAPFSPQIASIMDSVPLTPHQWQTSPFLVILPGLAAAAGCILAEIHGRCGYFPTICRLKPVGGPPPKFEPAELIGLSSVRELAREKR